MGSMEPGSEDGGAAKRLKGPPATEDKPPYEQKHAEEREQTHRKSKGSAWRRAVVPSLYVAGTGVLLYAAWRWLRPKDAPKESKIHLDPE